MKNLKLYNPNILIALLLVCTLGYSQQKYVESFNVIDNVEVSVNTSFTNVIFETWNKNKVEVEAFIEDDNLSKSEREQQMKNWKLDVLGNSKRITINSNVANQSFAMADMPSMDFIGPLMEDMVLPMIQNVKVPPLPEELLENIGNIQFDYEAFKKDEEGYMKKFEAQMDKKFGKDFEKRMEEWGKSFEAMWDEKRADSIGEAYGKKMEAWGENFGQRMEAWGEEYGQKMEAWASELERNIEKNGGDYSKTVTKSPSGTAIVIKGSSSNKTNRTIIIRLPKNTKTEINIRHGILKMADASNVNANLNYTPFTANSIDGDRTSINAAYAPVTVNLWKQGVLNIKFVDKCNIENLQNISLQANSSDVRIGTITNQAFLSGSFGNLRIDKVADGFETLDIRLENTDARVKVPTGAFSFYFTGNKSTLKYPKRLQLKESKNAGRVLVKGFNQNSATTKTITINSNYSNVSLQ
ncbi:MULTISPECIES: DUF4097 family beta strand repeat-containing protein [Aequorivita]|uniref:DUF4097 family beta strand repeat-containing protein n=2 Tax=Aequorivita TaxID=153265 RepID=A0AB35YRC9_9FLAO|nr:DUF4097 family beta strand repeat-containing protein [Aequorivita sp. Ant34-E75]WGF91244.1 DUF4097 family beta strand repeat-containing protein [Aequorivita sp. Ant34-E75]